MQVRCVALWLMRAEEVVSAFGLLGLLLPLYVERAVADIRAGALVARIVSYMHSCWGDEAARCYRV